MRAEHKKIRRIAHLDMDAFYASVELLCYPQLKGLPVVIGGGRRAIDDAIAEQYRGKPLADIPVTAFARLNSYTGRGVITTATYAARQSGIGSAMGLMKAAKLCPDAILLPVNFEQYRHYSRQFKNIILSFTPLIEDRGLDEVFIDFTEIENGQLEGGKVLAQTLQNTIFNTTGLTCSIGVAPNKLLAKIASELNKPNGISILFANDIAEKIWPLDCRKINGIGPKMSAALLQHGIQTIGQLAAADLTFLIAQFGKNTGTWLHNAAHGQDDKALSTRNDPVVISRETTFERDLHAVHDKAQLGAIFTQLCQRIAADLERKSLKGKTIGIKLRYDDFKSATRDITLPDYINDAKAIRHAAGLCLKRVALDQRIRLLGVRVGGLIKADAYEKLHAIKPLPDLVEQMIAAQKPSKNTL